MKKKLKKNEKNNYHNFNISLSFNLRFLQNKEEIYKINQEIKNAGEQINGFQKVDNLFDVADKINSTWGNIVNAFKTK